MMFFVFAATALVTLTQEVPVYRIDTISTISNVVAKNFQLTSIKSEYRDALIKSLESNPIELKVLQKISKAQSGELFYVEGWKPRVYLTGEMVTNLPRRIDANATIPGAVILWNCELLESNYDSKNSNCDLIMTVTGEVFAQTDSNILPVGQKTATFHITVYAKMPVDKPKVSATRGLKQVQFPKNKNKIPSKSEVPDAVTGNDKKEETGQEKR